MRAYRLAFPSLAAILSLLAATACDPVVRVPPRNPPETPVDPVIAACPYGMVGVPGGAYVLGQRKDRVTVAPFCLDRSEVTVERYLACVKEGDCPGDHLDAATPDGVTFVHDEHCNGSRSDRANHPINCVDVAAAEAFCSARGRRLPAEEEWEWAARGGAKGTNHPWGNLAYWESMESLNALCWIKTNPLDGTCPVGRFPAGDSPLGIHDLLGNVAEWTSSRFDPGSARVLRGAGWMTRDEGYINAAHRYGYPPAARESDLGFRCARDIEATAAGEPR